MLMPELLIQGQATDVNPSYKRQRKNMKDTTPKGGKRSQNYDNNNNTNYAGKKRKKQTDLSELDTQVILLPEEPEVMTQPVVVGVGGDVEDESRMLNWMMDNQDLTQVAVPISVSVPEPISTVVVEADKEVEILEIGRVVPSTSSNIPSIKTKVIRATSSAIIPTNPRSNAVTASQSATTTTIVPTKPSATIAAGATKTTTTTNISVPNSVDDDISIIEPARNVTSVSSVVSVQILNNTFEPTQFGLEKDFRLTNFGFTGRHRSCSNGVGSVTLSGKPALGHHINILHPLSPDDNEDLVAHLNSGSMSNSISGLFCNLKFTPGLDVSLFRPRVTRNQREELFLVKVTDMFYPVLDDPFLAGKVAGLSLLNKLHAVGVYDCDQILMLLTVAQDMKPEMRDVVIPRLIHGFQEVALNAKTRVTGGHTTLNPWVSIGGVATCVSFPNELIVLQSVEAGDFLILTKPIGIGVAVFAHEALQTGGERLESLLASTKLTEGKIRDMFEKAKDLMLQSNRIAAQLMHKYEAHGACDVSDFGLLGHAQNFAYLQQKKRPQTPLKLRIMNLPVIADTMAVSKALNFKLDEGFASEISGGLLIALKKNSGLGFIKELLQNKVQASIVGCVEANTESGVWTAEITSNARLLQK